MSVGPFGLTVDTRICVVSKGQSVVMLKISGCAKRAVKCESVPEDRT